MQLLVMVDLVDYNIDLHVELLYRLYSVPLNAP